VTLGTIDIEEIKKHLTERNKGVQLPGRSTSQPTQDESHLSGKILARRLSGLLKPEDADLIEQHINESCEQEND
jgi:hypothetical protein